MFPNVVIKVGEVSTSDHLPLFLDLNRRIYVEKDKRFRFENMWIREKDCHSLINNYWNREGLVDIIEKLALCCEKLEEWGGGMVKEIRESIASYRKRMKNLRSRRDAQGVNQYNDIRGEFPRLIEKQEIYWQQRAKQYWLAEGDQNTRVFHKYAASRKRSNSIKGLQDLNGVWKEDSKDVQEIITEYYSTLFKSSGIDGKLIEGKL